MVAGRSNASAGSSHAVDCGQLGYGAGVRERRGTVRGLLLLGAAGAALLVVWLTIAVVAASSSDDVCADHAPADATAVQQHVAYWPPTVTCRYFTPGTVVVAHHDEEARQRLAAMAIAAALAVAAWLLIAYRVFNHR